MRACSRSLLFASVFERIIVPPRFHNSGHQRGYLWFDRWPASPVSPFYVFICTVYSSLPMILLCASSCIFILRASLRKRVRVNERPLCARSYISGLRFRVGWAECSTFPCEQGYDAQKTNKSTRSRSRTHTAGRGLFTVHYYCCCSLSE